MFGSEVGSFSPAHRRRAGVRGGVRPLVVEVVVLVRRVNSREVKEVKGRRAVPVKRPGPYPGTGVGRMKESNAVLSAPVAA